MSNVIFDLGFHNGDDTDYYLKKGYKVIAIDANPRLVSEGKIRFDREIQEGTLTLLQRCFYSDTSCVEFYLHPTKDDWSSCNKIKVEWDGSSSKKILIDGVTLQSLYKLAHPFYIKTDIEGNDSLLVQQLLGIPQELRPKYVSVELSRFDYYEIFSYLHVAGYNRFQLVNQANNENKIDEKINYKFSKYSSGLFGVDLPRHKWGTIDTVLTNYMKYKELKGIDNQELALGWVDLHATII